MERVWPALRPWRVVACQLAAVFHRGILSFEQFFFNKRSQSVQDQSIIVSNWIFANKHLHNVFSLKPTPYSNRSPAIFARTAHSFLDIETISEGVRSFGQDFCPSISGFRQRDRPPQPLPAQRPQYPQLPHRYYQTKRTPRPNAIRTWPLTMALCRKTRLRKTGLPMLATRRPLPFWAASLVNAKAFRSDFTDT